MARAPDELAGATRSCRSPFAAVSSAQRASILVKTRDEVAARIVVSAGPTKAPISSLGYSFQGL